MSRKKTLFNSDWINPSIRPAWAAVFAEVKGDPFSAHCKLCGKSFALSNMGRMALVSHEKSVGHKKRISSNNVTPCVTTLLNSKNGHTDLTIPDQRENSVISECTIAEEILEAEILWCLHAVETHASLNSVDKTIPVLKRMFKCPITDKMKLSSKKMAYYITFGLAPYFSDELEGILLKCEFYVACFDESFNKISQRGQMDLVIRFWNLEKNIVETRYFKSVFMNSAKAEDILDCFKLGITPLKLILLN